MDSLKKDGLTGWKIGGLGIRWYKQLSIGGYYSTS